MTAKPSIHFKNIGKQSNANSRYLQRQMADRTVLQMDQTEFKNQNPSRNLKECRDDSDLDSDDLLPFDVLH